MARTAVSDHESTDYEVPLVHVRVPERVGNAAMWLGLAGAVAASAVDLPVAALIAAGVIVMRRHAA